MEMRVFPIVFTIIANDNTKRIDAHRGKAHLELALRVPQNVILYAW